MFSFLFNENKKGGEKTEEEEEQEKQQESLLQENQQEKKDNEIIIELRLGDIIKIIDPRNENLNEQTFIIDYIDNSKMLLINDRTFENIKLKIHKDGSLGDGTITKLAILSRSEFTGYARQHNLIPNTWINIYFAGDIPIVFTGQITNLENDMIEIQTYPEKDTIYINFDYKGIPEDIPIELIEIREKPQMHPSLVLEEEGKEEDINFPNLEKEHDVIATEKLHLTIPVADVKNQIREFIFKSNQLHFGNEELGKIVQYVNITNKSQRYSIETQVNDLLDDLLSTIPNVKRTTKVLNNIHIIIERFKQLREKFSVFDEYGNVTSPLINEATYKPIINYFKEFNKNLYWIVPVVQNIKKIYNSENIDENNDIVILETTDDIQQMQQYIDTYKSDKSQNKYSTLFNELNPFLTPFQSISEEKTNDLLIEKEVKSDINVIIDNLGDLYSSIFNKQNIKSRRFIIQKYNLGLQQLEAINLSGSNNITKRVKLTDPDVMSIKSFITLPEPIIRFSRINLPGTNLLDKTNLNATFLNYWQFLKKNTNVHNIVITNLDEQISYNEENFANNIKNYILNLSEDNKHGLTNTEIYYEFIKLIIPKTKIIFNLMKKYIIGKLSIVDVVSYLEPFLIYTDTLTFTQYKQIIEFISEKISEYNIKLKDRGFLFMSLNRKKNENILFHNAFSLIDNVESNNNLRADIFDAYDINYVHNVKETLLFTNSEILKKINSKDNNKLYTLGLSLQNIPLMFPHDFSNLFDNEKNGNDNEIDDESERNICNNIIIAKSYKSIEELNQDNDKEIYFDKKYDTTNYNLLDEYEKDLLKMSSEEFIIHLKTELQKKLKLNDKDAVYLSDSLIRGYKKVIDGQYALLVTQDTSKSEYYIRNLNKWQIDKNIDKIFKTNLSKIPMTTTNSNILCNLQDKCISNPNDDCESLRVNELNIKNDLLNDIMNEFDEKYKITSQEYKDKIQKKYDYSLSNISIISKIETNNLLKYNNQKYKLSINEDEEKMITVSPYKKILDLILSQSDYIKKQNDIIRFVNTFTRYAIVDNVGPHGEIECENWYYCIKTNIKLIPVFMFYIATTFLEDTLNGSNRYNEYIELYVTHFGKLSDDGDKWIDVNSGWTIKKIGFNFEEGYEEGFKISSRSILEQDLGNKIITKPLKTTITQMISPQTNMISNIVNAISIAMGINIETQKEFIINCVLQSIEQTIDDEEEYKRKNKNKKVEDKQTILSYEDFYNTAILYYTLGMILIAIQTSIPSIKTRKTFPGCIKSFSGYPIEGAGDYSSLTYITCITYQIRKSSSQPWNVLKRTKQEGIYKKLKGFIDEILLHLIEVKRKIVEKTEYLLTTNIVDEEIPLQYNILNWTEFLPPLIPFKIKRLLDISPEFKSSLTQNLKLGSSELRSQVLIIYSKIIQFSLAVQEKIQNIVKQKQLLLHKQNNDPFLENACCNTKLNQNTIQYFIDEDNSIKEYNDTVHRLTNMIADIISYSKSGLFYSEINTKNIYSSTKKEFDDITIYLAFIHFCKFKSLLPIPEELLPLCTEKPVLNKNESLPEIIKKLKDDGKIYSNESFLRLLQIVSKNNIISTNTSLHINSTIDQLKNVLKYCNEQNEQIIDKELRDLMMNVLDNFEISNLTTTMTKETRALDNFLLQNNSDLKDEILEFIHENKGNIIKKNKKGGLKLIEKINNTITQLSDWKDTEVEEIDAKDKDIEKSKNNSIYNIINFFKTFIDNFSFTFPNIILNKVNYKNILVPNYWKLSTYHSKEIKNMVGEYYDSLTIFYDNSENDVNNILQNIQQKLKNLVNLSKNTPCFISKEYNDKELYPLFNERTGKLLFEHYLLKILFTYIELTDDKKMILMQTKQEEEEEEKEEDIFSSDFIDEKNTRTETISEPNIIKGNKKELKEKVAKLLLVFIELMDDHKSTINISYKQIIDNIFKLKEREKNLLTDRLKSMNDIERKVDNEFNKNKLGEWGKGLQKGLTIYTEENYNNEIEFREKMINLENKLSKKKKENENMDDLVDDYLENAQIQKEIEHDEYDMNQFTEDYEDGDGPNNDEGEPDDYNDYDS